MPIAAWIPYLVAALLAVSTGFAVMVLARATTRSVIRLRTPSKTIGPQVIMLPLWMRVCAALVATPAAQLGPIMPVDLRESLQERLRRAGLEDEITPPQFLMIGVALALATALLAYLIGAPWWLVIVVAALAGATPSVWLVELTGRRRDEVVRELPLYVDMLTLALEAGGSLSVALRVATERSPDSVLRRAFLRVQGDLRAGRSRAEALRTLGERLDLPAMKPLVAALIQADASGGSLAAVLRAQSEQRLNERFARAEKRAMEAPVRMLGPLVLCIFPCTFLILGFPVVMRFFAD
jgi:tight adherence protein C